MNTSPPKFSVIIPVRNENGTLKDTIFSVRKNAKEPTEFIVVDGGSSDASLDIARESADQVLNVSPPGRARQMQKGAAAAKGDILLFLHADTKLPDSWQDCIMKGIYSNDNTVLTAFELGFDSSTFLYRILSRLANWRTRRLTGVPHGDQAIAIKRDVFMKSGGFPDVPIMEEYYLVKNIKKLGRIKVLSEKVVTSTRRYHKNGTLFNAFRNLFIIILFYFGVPPNRLIKFYR